MTYVVSRSKTFPGLWKVEATDPNPPYEHYAILFNGSNAEAMANEYATWKNVRTGGSYRGINGGMFRS